MTRLTFNYFTQKLHLPLVLLSLTGIVMTLPTSIAKADMKSPTSYLLLVNKLKQKLKDLEHNPSIRPFNGEIIFSVRGKTLIHHPIQLVQEIQGVSKPGQVNYVIASLTKQITAALVLQAVDEGRLLLSDVAAKYLNDRDVDDLSLPKYQSTIHNLLAHLSGYVDGRQELVSKPGTTFHYASWSYAVLGHILANIYGLPFPELANRLFQKVGMRHSYAPHRAKINLLRQKNHELIKGYHCREDDCFVEANPEIGGNRGAAGAVIAPAQDLALWCHELHQGKILPPPLYKLMITPFSQSEHNVFGPIGYGYGLQISHTDVGLEFSHLGHIPGYQSMMLYYPDVELCVILLINSDRLGQDDSHQAYNHLRTIREIAIHTALALKELV